MRRLGLAIAALVLGACRPGPRPAPPPDVVATVNGEPITAGALAKALRRAQREDENLTPRTGEDQAAFRKATLDDLVNQALLLQAAKAVNTSVPNDRVEREVMRLKADYPGKSFDEALAEGSTTAEELREQIKSQLLVEAFFASQVYARVAVTDADVEAYYQAHKDDFAHPEQVHAEQILVTDADTAHRVQQELRQGQRFEELARKYSISPDAKVGGDLGYFPKGQMPEPFDSACFTLKAGQVSDVVQSPYGYHLIKVLEHQAAGTPPLADIRPKVEAVLRKSREAAAQQAKLDELHQKAQITINEKVLAAAP
ncbi:MAG: peptidyl-prolyl cis-trans isomerase [Deltaproteobacteria bacterium]|nr:peptidyl-prolyl cis-trans isomerase [Deltaproteobacteria bacterium]